MAEAELTHSFIDPMPERGDLEEARLTFDPKTVLITAAIDFGTTFSGYGFAFKSQPEEIRVNKNWGQELGMLSVKTPTSVLLTRDGEFVSFGYKAELDYTEYGMEEEKEQYILFRNFKMLLYKEKELNISTKIKSVCGKEHDAVDVFAKAIQFLGQHLLDTARGSSVNPIERHEVRWVLTIPAIWSDRAKQFMREACLRAGIITKQHPEQLMFALEPEAAALCCKDGMEEKFTPGTKYMIIDAGGGTIDIAAHEINNKGKLIELMCATGGAWGGTQIDQCFESLMSEVLGTDFIQNYKSNYPSDWLNFMTNFERKKRALNLSSQYRLSLDLPWSMIKCYTEVTGKEINVVLQDASPKGIRFTQGKIVLQHETSESLFKESLDNIVNHIQGIFQSVGRLSNLNYIFVVGGYGESKFLLDRLRKEFEHVCPVLSPLSAVESVLKGAVLFGQYPYGIAARRARKTYGTLCNKPFDSSLHDEERMFENENGEKYCRGLFHTYICKDELIYINKFKTFFSRPRSSRANQIYLKFYSTDAKNVMYVDEPCVKKVGGLSVDIPPVPGITRDNRSIKTKVYFGKTEIKVIVKDTSRKGHKVCTHIDFLGF